MNRSMFELKFTKRDLEKDTVRKILSYGDMGCVVTLCGPAIETHYSTLKHLLRPKSELLMVDAFKGWSPEDIESENLKGRGRTLHKKDPRVAFISDDVWSVLHNRYIRANGWNGRHVFFDLDFCASAITLEEDGKLMSNLSKLINSKLPRQSGCWINITLSMRTIKGFGDEWVRLDCRIKELFWRHAWSVPYAESVIYKSGADSAPMARLLYRIKTDYNRI